MLKKILILLGMMLLMGGIVFATDMTPEEWLQYNRQITDMMHQRAEQVANGEMPPIKCATPLILNVQNTRPDNLSLKSLFPSREDSMSFTYTSDHFLLHYTDNGANAVYQYATQTIEPNAPDYIVMAARILDSVWNHTVNGLGFPQPLSDGYYNGGGNGLFDIYFINFGAYGATVVDSIVTLIPTYTGTGYMFLENDYQGFVGYENNRLNALRISAAHEFTHACQFAIDLQEVEVFQGRPSYAWMEMSATFMETEHYPQIKDYLNYVPYFFSVPSWSIRTGTDLISGTDSLGRLNYRKNYHQYASVVFPIYLASRFDPEIITTIWDGCGQVAGPNWIPSTDAAVQQYSGDMMTLADAFQDFATWNLFTGPRTRIGYFPDADLYDTVSLAAWVTSYPQTVAVNDSLFPDNLGADYVILDSLATMPAGLLAVLEPDESQPWGVTVVEYQDNPALPVAIRHIKYDSLSPYILIPDAGAYDKIALIPEVLGGNGFEVSYSMTIAPLTQGMIAPGNGDILHVGSLSKIWWYLGGGVDSVRIEISIDNGSTWEDIAVTGNDFAYAWTVPDTPSDSCKMKVSAYPSGNPAYVSTGVFRIEGAMAAHDNADGAGRPAEFSLGQNYPNPFNPETRIEYAVSRQCHVTVDVFNIIGQRVRTLVDREQQAGEYVVTWDGRDDRGKPSASGIYLYRIKAQDYVAMKRMLLLR